MLVLGAIPDVQYHKLRRAAAGQFTFVRAQGWGQVLDIIRERPVELAVLDPLLSGEPGSHEIEKLRQFFPSLPLIFYTSLTPELCTVLLALGNKSIREVILSRLDDHPTRLREALERQYANAASQQFLEQLAGALAPLPAELRWVLEEALRIPEEVQTVQHLAIRASVNRRTCERWFTRAHLPSPRHFLAAARVLYAHRLLLDPGFTIEDVAKRLGYTRVKTLQQHVRTYLGRTAGEIRMSLTTEVALETVVHRFLTVTNRAAAG